MLVDPPAAESVRRLRLLLLPLIALACAAAAFLRLTPLAIGSPWPASGNVYGDPMQGYCKGGLRGDKYLNDKMRPHTPSELQCRAFCDEDPGCTGYSHQPSNGGFCFVYGAVDESSPAPWMVRTSYGLTEIVSGDGRRDAKCFAVTFRKLEQPGSRGLDLFDGGLWPCA